MLNDATYQSAPPLVAVSEELFRSREDVTGVKWSVVNEFRRRIQVYGCFRFAYITSTVSGGELHTILVELGLQFSVCQVLVVGNPASERHAWELLSAMDFHYCPLIAELVKAPRSFATLLTPTEFSSRLGDFSQSGIPYNKTVFKDYLNGRY
jgi:hypothetical protein